MHFRRFLNDYVPFGLQNWKVHSSSTTLVALLIIHALYSPKFCNLVSHGGSVRSQQLLNGMSLPGRLHESTR